MQRVSLGYTIIEVLIFLAVSGFLIGISFIFLTSQENTTRFSQSMRDIQSKVNDWMNDVATGFPVGVVASQADYANNTLAGKLHCSVNGGGNVQISDAKPSDASKSQSDCIFLGKAVQFTQKNESQDQSHFVYTYSVFGSRLDSASGDLASNMAEANPTAAGPPGSGSANLTEEYQLGGDTRVISIKSTALNRGAATDHLVGLYSNLNTQQSTSTNGSEDLKVFSYPLGYEALNSSAVGRCINMQTCAYGQVNPDGLQNLDICFSSDSAGQTALLTIKSNDGLGASTELQFKVCS